MTAIQAADPAEAARANATAISLGTFGLTGRHDLSGMAGGDWILLARTHPIANRPRKTKYGEYLGYGKYSATMPERNVPATVPPTKATVAKTDAHVLR